MLLLSTLYTASSRYHLASRVWCAVEHFLCRQAMAAATISGKRSWVGTGCGIMSRRRRRGRACQTALKPASTQASYYAATWNVAQLPLMLPLHRGASRERCRCASTCAVAARASSVVYCTPAWPCRLSRCPLILTFTQSRARTHRQCRPTHAASGRGQHLHRTAPNVHDFCQRLWC
jgi:hypothetical protein